MNQIYNRIESGQRKIPIERKNLQEAIAKLQEKHAAGIERMIRLHRLRETQRIKDQLEQKLTHLQDRIEVLNDIEGTPKTQKLKLQNKEVRHEFMELEEERRKETSEFTKKLSEEQRERLRKRKEELKQLSQAAKEAEDREAEIARKQKEENLQRMRDQEKQKFEQLAEKRKEYMQTIAKLPTKKLSETLQRHTSMPELEKKKQEIAAKRSLVNWSEVKDHMRVYDEEKKKKSERGVLDTLMAKGSSATQPKFEKSKFMESLEEEETRRKQEEEHQREEFSKRIQMKKRYGEIVKEMYAPVVDPDKRQEIEERSQKLQNKGRAVRSNADSTRTVRTDADQDGFVKHKPKKVKKHPKSQPPDDEKEVKKPKDYLNEQRRGREAADAELFQKLQSSPRHIPTTEGDDVQTLLSKINQREQATLQKERLLKRLEATNPQALAAREDLDMELLTSVKTKLALIKTP